MLYAKFQGNRLGSCGVDDSLMFLFHIGILIMWPGPSIYNFFPLCLEAAYEI